MSPEETWSTPQARILASLVLLAMALRVPFELWSDTWYNLVMGREIATSGLVTHNDLTQQGLGVECVDQQWLAHAAYYSIAAHLGLVAVVVVASVVPAAALVAAVWVAIGRGATPGRTLLVGVVVLGVVVSQAVARAQTLAIPFLVAFPAALANDARSPRPKTWWLVPCAVVWANLHGSVLLAPVLGVLLFVGRFVDAWRRGEAPPRPLVRRDALLAFSLGGAIFASPYAAALPAYYRSTFANPAFRAYLSEWQPPSLLEAPGAFVLGAVVLTLVGSRFRALPFFESSLGVLLTIGTLTSVRHATPLALTVAPLLPGWADSALGGVLRVESDGFLQRASRLVLPVSLAVFATIPLLAGRSLLLQFPVAFADQVATMALDRGFLLADESQADRLLWFHPELRGRISHDARVETLPVEFLQALALLYSAPDASLARRLLAMYDVVVVGRDEQPRLFESMRRDPQWARFADDRHASAFVRRDRRGAFWSDPVTGRGPEGHVATAALPWRPGL